jgi:predicted O-methyltransferase YrrM
MAAVVATVAAASPATTEAEVSEEAGYEFSADWTTPHTPHWLRHLARFIGKPGVHGVEIGCFEGRSSIWFLERIANHPSARMTCIDVFTDAIEQRFDHNLRVAGLGDRMIKRKGYSQDVLRTLEPESYDFVYIDGCHLASCVLTDAVLAWDLLKPGGMIVFDDYLWQLQEPPTQRPKLAIDAFLAIFRDRIRVRLKEHQVIVEKKGERTKASLVGTPVVHGEEWEEEYEQQQKKKDRDAR